MMLESIQVIERLHWPQQEFSRKYILSPADKSLNPGQVCQEKLSSEKLSSSILKDLFTTGTSSYNVLLQTEKEERKSPKLSPRRPKRATRRASTNSSQNHNHRHPVTLNARVGSGDTRLSNQFLLTRSLQDGIAPRPTYSITVLGSSMGLTPRPDTRSRKALSCSPSTRLPMLSKERRPREGENGCKKFCMLTAIKPSNVDKEKARFFKSDFTCNPQFEYSNPVPPIILAKHNTASDRFLTQAIRIMDLALHKYGNYENFEQITGGNLLTRGRIWFNVKKYMEKEGCTGEIVVQVTDDLLSRASMTVVNSRPTLTINTATAREHWLEGMLRHEIGTHYFRGTNNSRQPWGSSAGRRKHGLRPLNPTEEGLASIHSVLSRKDPTLWRAALLYYTVYQAGRLSFAQLFHSLGRFVQDPHTRWDYCVRAKRGQTDTALPGCFSKDQVYLDGILKILRHRDKIDFQMLVALGKVSFEDVDRLKGQAQLENVRIPHFLQDQAAYAEHLEKIMEVNQLTDQELRILI